MSGVKNPPKNLTLSLSAQKSDYFSGPLGGYPQSTASDGGILSSHSGVVIWITLTWRTVDGRDPKANHLGMYETLVNYNGR